MEGLRCLNLIHIFLMTTEDAVEYAKTEVPQMDWDAESMECKRNWRWKPELCF